MLDLLRTDVLVKRCLMISHFLNFVFFWSLKGVHELGQVSEEHQNMNHLHWYAYLFLVQHLFVSVAAKADKALILASIYMMLGSSFIQF